MSQNYTLIGRTIRSSELTHEERVELFGAPLAELLREPAPEAPLELVVTRVNHATGEITLSARDTGPSQGELARAAAAREPMTIQIGPRYMLPIFLEPGRHT